MEDLNKLVEQAKKQMEKQQADEQALLEEKIKNDGNMYDDFIKEQEEEDTIYSADEEINIQNTPTHIDNYKYTINNSPEENEELPKIDEYDSPIFPNGPLQSEINSWKKQYIGYDIYATEVCGDYFVFRTLNRFEYKQIVALQNTDPLMREEIICETCTLFPPTYKWNTMATGKAGVPATYSQIIMEKSGFTKDYYVSIL